MSRGGILGVLIYLLFSPKPGFIFGLVFQAPSLDITPRPPSSGGRIPLLCAFLPVSSPGLRKAARFHTRWRGAFYEALSVFKYV